MVLHCSWSDSLPRFSAIAMCKEREFMRRKMLILSVNVTYVFQLAVLIQTLNKNISVIEENNKTEIQVYEVCFKIRTKNLL